MTRNPNEAKFFDEKRGCTLNVKCPDCGCKIYVPEGRYTMYNGKKNYHNRHDKVMSVHHFKKGAVCEGCWDKEQKNGL